MTDDPYTITEDEMPSMNHTVRCDKCGRHINPLHGDNYKLAVVHKRCPSSDAPAVPINVVFDGPPGPTAGRFVEVETDDGRSVRVGEWIRRDDGLWALRIERALATHPADGDSPAVPDGDWLWQKLMEWCKKRGVAPADYNDLFSIVGEARAAAPTLDKGEKE